MLNINLNLSESFMQCIIQWIEKNVKDLNMFDIGMILLVIMLFIIVKKQQTRIEILLGIIKNWENFGKKVEKFLNEMKPELDVILPEILEINKIKEENKNLLLKSHELEKQLIKKTLF